MDLKKKLKKFFTLRRRANAGFTLVELIVVIAILSILGGVGTAGYSGYIKNANKKADQVLVGNVIRAIETGTNSLMFVNDDSFKMGRISYPVGLITLTASESKNSKVMVSYTLRGGAETSPCSFEEIQNVIIRTEHTVNSACPKNDQGIYYTISAPSTVRYCSVHGPDPIIEEVNGQSYVSAISHSGTNLGLGCWNHKWNKTESVYPSGAVIISNQAAVSLEKSANLCEYAYAYQHDTFIGTTDIGAATTGNALYDAIEAAFGDVESIKLKFNGWTSDEGVDYATFYTAAPKVMDGMESLTSTLVTASNSLGKDTLGLSKNYSSSEEVLLGVADTITTTLPTEEAWMVQWNGAANATWDSYGFGLPGRENYSAARVGYNTAFASYLEARGVSAQYVTAIKDFYSQDLILAKLPGLVCTDAFTDSESKLRGQIGNDEVFAQIAELFEEYKVSLACEENGRVFYQVIQTFDETADIASRQVADGKYDSIYSYYNTYVDEISALYNSANSEAENGVVIIVTVEDGLVKCHVSPSAANPRKD